MGVVLGWLFFLLFLVFVIGLIKPTLLKKESRKEVVKLMSFLFLVWLGLLILTSGLNDFLFFLCFLSIVFLLIGLIKPAKIKMNSRKKAFLIMGSSFLIFFILSMVTLPDLTSEETLALEQKKIEEQEKEQKVKEEKESEELAKTEELKKKQDEEAKEKELEEQEKAKELEEQNRIAEEAKAKELEEQKRVEEELARQKAAEAEAARVAQQKAAEEEAARIAQQKAAEAEAARIAQETSESANVSTNTSESYQNCTELRKVYPDGVASTHPAYESQHDRDKDNWACER